MRLLKETAWAALAALLVSTLIVSVAGRVQAAGMGRIAPSATEIDPVKVGDRAPAFTVKTVAGEDFRFDPGRLERPAVLISFRGGWCPYCNLHLSELHTVIPEIRDMGIDVLFLSGDRPELLYSSLKSETQEAIDGLDYTILSDAGIEAAKALGIAFHVPDSMLEGFASRGTDIGGSSMKNFQVLPVPAVFVVDRDGTIKFAFTEPDYKIRLPAAKVLEAARMVAD